MLCKKKPKVPQLWANVDQVLALTTDTGLCKLNPKIYQGCVLVFTIQTWKASIRRCLKASSITCCLAMRLLASFKYSSWWQHIRRKRHSAAGSINSMLKSPSTMFSNTNYQKKKTKKNCYSFIILYILL